MTAALSIGGSDSSCGAGIQADLTTFQEMRIQGATAITCITAQNRYAVRDIHPLPPEVVSAQIDAVFEALPIQAVKIGMLYNAGIIKIVAENLRRRLPILIVLDPVIVSSSGCALLEEDAVAALKEELFPLAALATPNLREAHILLNRPFDDFADGGRGLLELGSQAILIKGGHHPEEKGWDCLAVRTEHPLWLKQKTIQTADVHGTGCRLSAAIAAFLAKGFCLNDAVFHGKSYVHRFIHG